MRRCSKTRQPCQAMQPHQATLAQLLLHRPAQSLVLARSAAMAQARRLSGAAAGLTARAPRAQTGTIVQATLAQNWTEQAMTYTYASLRPNTVDAAPYAAALAGLAAVARGLASGRGAPASGGGGAPSCNAPLPMLNECAPARM